MTDSDSPSGRTLSYVRAIKHRIHLNFDDGPHLVNTPRLLDELKKFGVDCGALQPSQIWLDFASARRVVCVFCGAHFNLARIASQRAEIRNQCNLRNLLDTTHPCCRIGDPAGRVLFVTSRGEMARASRASTGGSL